MLRNLCDIKISIIIPIYNIEKYIQRCIDSVLNQTHSNLEIILVDDGSTDSSSSICDQYAQNDMRVKVLHKDNGGPASTRRAGLEIATGQYVGFVDGDDYVEEEMFGYLLKQLVESEADFIHSGFYKDKGQVQSNVCNFEDRIYDVHNEKVEFIKTHVLDSNKEYMHPSMFSKLFKVELIKDSYGAVPDDMYYGEDLVNLVSCILNAEKIATCGKSFYHYVFRENSITNDISKKLEREFELYKGLINFFTECQLVNDVKKNIDCLFYNQILETFSSLGNRYLCVSQYCIKDISDIENKKVVIYGAGKVGIDLYQQLCRNEKCNVVTIVDSNYRNIFIDYVTVRSVDELLTLNFDIILVAVKYQSVAEEIMESLVQRGIDKKKIMWKCPDNVFDVED